MPYGLSKERIEQIKDKIATFSDIEEVLLFGSRAKGTEQEGSDIDLVLIGDIEHKELLSLKSALNDLGSPYTFDVLVYSDIKKKALKEHIDRVGISFYSKKDTAKERN